MRKPIDPTLIDRAKFMPPLKNTASPSKGVRGWIRDTFSLPDVEAKKLFNKWRVRADRNDEHSPWVRAADPNGRNVYTGRLYGLKTVPEIEHRRFRLIELVMSADAETLQKMLSTFSEGEHEKT